jgi:hypothetical protein
MIRPGSAERLRWALRQHRRPRTLAGLARLCWHDFVIHVLFEGGERCQDCGRSYAPWLASDSLYREVYGSLRGLLCPLCFSRRAEAKGLPVRFEARVTDQRPAQAA